MAMFTHPFMAHHGLYLMMHNACIINEHDYDTMKEAFIDDVSDKVEHLSRPTATVVATY